MNIKNIALEYRGERSIEYRLRTEQGDDFLSLTYHVDGDIEVCLQGYFTATVTLRQLISLAQLTHDKTSKCPI